MTKKRVRAPSTTFGTVKIKYVQVPYDNRFFYLYKDGNVVLRIPSSNLKHGIGCFMFPTITGPAQHKALRKQLERFNERVTAYDDHLDQCVGPRAPDTTFALKP